MNQIFAISVVDVYGKYTWAVPGKDAKGSKIA